MHLYFYNILIKLIVTFIYKFKYTICNNAIIKFLIIASIRYLKQKIFNNFYSFNLSIVLKIIKAFYRC